MWPDGFSKFYQKLKFICIENVLKCIKLAKADTKQKINSSKCCRQLLKITQRAQFRQTWSHWWQRRKIVPCSLCPLCHEGCELGTSDWDFVEKTSCIQCYQIGLYLKNHGNKFSYNGSPNIWCLSGIFQFFNFLNKNCWSHFLVNFRNIETTFDFNVWLHWLHVPS